MAPEALPKALPQALAVLGLHTGLPPSGLNSEPRESAGPRGVTLAAVPGFPRVRERCERQV